MTPPEPTVRYDATIIEQMAKRLLDRAQRLVIFYTLVGIVLGLMLLAGAGTAMPGGRLMAWIGLMLFTGIGYAIGSGRAFTFKLQAHMLLCQVAIERNTAQFIRLIGERGQ